MAVAWELVVRERAPDVPAVGSVRLDVLAPGELLFMPISENAVLSPDTCEGPGFVIG